LCQHLFLCQFFATGLMSVLPKQLSYLTTLLLLCQHLFLCQFFVTGLFQCRRRISSDSFYMLSRCPDFVNITITLIKSHISQ
ncbi:MAG: hypothetical protein Q8920_06545, partial [Bacillota bacterium]|nr:hypothetical protein [Bacillota bacterium]